MKTEKLEAMEARYLSIEDQLSDPSVIANQNKWRENTQNCRRLYPSSENIRK